MDIAKLASLPFRYRPWRPRHARLIMVDLLKPASGEQRPHEVHLQGAIDWLCQAQDVRDGEADTGSVSAGWSFEDGWLPGYPETTGYIIETFLSAAEILKQPELVERAARMIDWELSIQLPDGAFPGHFGEAGSRPVIFNTGQIMHGMIAGYSQLGRADCLEAATRAAHDYGFICIVVEDACATRDLKYGEDITLAKDVHNTTLSTLSRTYARIMTKKEFLNYMEE